MGKQENGKNRNFLQQQFHTGQPNQIWVSDITAFKFGDKYYYLCAIIDLFSRKIISYRISQNSSTQLLAKTFKHVYPERKPEKKLMFHSDWGTQYMSYTFVHVLEDFGVKNPFLELDNLTIMQSQKRFSQSLKKKNYIGGTILPKRI